MEQKKRALEEKDQEIQRLEAERKKVKCSLEEDLYVEAAGVLNKWRLKMQAAGVSETDTARKFVLSFRPYHYRNFPSGKVRFTADLKADHLSTTWCYRKYQNPATENLDLYAHEFEDLFPSSEDVPMLRELGVKYELTRNFYPFDAKHIDGRVRNLAGLLNVGNNNTVPSCKKTIIEEPPAISLEAARHVLLSDEYSDDPTMKLYLTQLVDCYSTPLAHWHSVYSSSDLREPYTIDLIYSIVRDLQKILPENQPNYQPK